LLSIVSCLLQVYRFIPDCSWFRIQFLRLELEVVDFAILLRPLIEFPWISWGYNANIWEVKSSAAIDYSSDKLTGDEIL
jgi:hypothetical protein